jgi:hypothetical protein
MARNEDRLARLTQRAHMSLRAGAHENSVTIERKFVVQNRDTLDEIYAAKRRAEAWRGRTKLDDAEFVISSG